MQVTSVLAHAPWNMGASLPMANGPGERPSKLYVERAQSSQIRFRVLRTKAAK